MKKIVGHLLLSGSNQASTECYCCLNLTLSPSCFCNILFLALCVVWVIVAVLVSLLQYFCCKLFVVSKEKLTISLLHVGLFLATCHV